MGSPSEYLKKVTCLQDIQLDYALANRYREREVKDTMDAFRDSCTQAGHGAGADQLTLVALQCLLTVMSSK